MKKMIASTFILVFICFLGTLLTTGCDSIDRNTDIKTDIKQDAGADPKEVTLLLQQDNEKGLDSNFKGDEVQEDISAQRADNGEE